jgi:4-carboxymuconolactone decarboxylase
MARLPYVDPEQASPEVREALEILPPLNIFRTVAHAETCFRPFLRLGQAILTKQKLDPMLRELAILRVARLTPAEYEWVQHVEIAKAVGATEEQVAALETGDAEADCFSPDQQLVLRFTTDVVSDARTSDETYAELSKLLSDQEIVELVLAIGYYMAIARVMEVAQIDVDPPAGTGVIGTRV